MANHSQFLAEPEISQIQGDYISVYDFIEWAREKYPNYTSTANDLIRLLKGKNIQLYNHYNGIKETIEKSDISLKTALEFIAKNNGYNEPFDYDDIPF